MRKNDYHVVAYSILSYLYDCLKQGKAPSDEFLRLDWYPAELPLRYRYFIYEALSERGYIYMSAGNSINPEGISIRAEITAKGIDYLYANDLMVWIAQGFDEEDAELFSKINEGWVTA